MSKILRQAKWYAPHPPWLWMPDKASEHTCRRRQRYKDAMLRPGGGGPGGALPETPGQKDRLNFLLCCRCCQALLHIFSSPHSLGSVSHRPEPSGGFFGAQTSRLQCPSTRADADTINTGCHFPTTEMRETTGDLRWDRVRVHLLCLTVENAIDRATGGKRLDAALPEMVANHASADRARPVWR